MSQLQRARKPFKEKDDSSKDRKKCCMASANSLQKAGKLGEGTFGDVYHCPSNPSLAIKVLRLNDPDDIEEARMATTAVENEVMTLNMLNKWGIGPAGYHCKNMSRDDEKRRKHRLNFKYVTRTMDSFDLALNWFFNNQDRADMPATFARSLLRCTDILDHNKVVLLDLTPQNAFLVPDENGQRDMIIIDPGDNNMVVHMPYDGSDTITHEATVYTTLLWLSYFLNDFATEVQDEIIKLLRDGFFETITINDAKNAIEKIDMAVKPDFGEFDDNEKAQIKKMQENGSYQGIPVVVRNDGTWGFYVYHGATFFLLHYLVHHGMSNNSERQKSIRKRRAEERKGDDLQQMRNWYFDNYVSVYLKDLFG